MLPRHARCGVSVVAVQAALLAREGLYAQMWERQQARGEQEQTSPATGELIN